MWGDVLEGRSMCPALVLGFGVLLPWAYAWVPGQHYTQSEELFLVGGSCDAGWSTDKALQFSRPDPNRHLFTIIAGLKTDGFGFKMLRSRSGWNDDVGIRDETRSRKRKMGHLPSPPLGRSTWGFSGPAWQSSGRARNFARQTGPGEREG